MAEQVYLGVDLGAESGRVVAGLWDGRRIRLEELHRFPNGGVWVGESLRWDIVRLWSEVQNGLRAAAKRFGGAVWSVGVDTWGVDFALLSATDELVGLPFHYRDPRTRGVMARTLKTLPKAEVFAATGLQFMEINTLFQLIALREQHPESLAAARSFLMIPDFLNWCLSGVRSAEFTNATTTQFFNPVQRAWAVDLLRRAQLPTDILPAVANPGDTLGPLRASVASRAGLSPDVRLIAPATHDTGSAVAAVPTEATGSSRWAYISSGTWSLMGVEVKQAILTPRALELNMTNEGGIEGTYRLLKNIMGLWLAQQCKMSFERRGSRLGYDDLVRAAQEATPLRSIVDPDDPSFLSPEDMPEALRAWCRRAGQPVPQTEGELIRCALESLAIKYASTLSALEELTGASMEVVHVVGGGSQNELLNQFTADACGCPVLAGPVEATALGNVMVQARAAGEIGSLGDLRRIVRDSSSLRCFVPGRREPWLEAAGRLRRGEG
ncbi:MAG: rhamnulokinase [Verrucomicrobia bacterium]|nr:rhamnulokinase [Verrucomicrobiota bacterium]MBI3870125.1 rhamnulokinase [Verrucomicrobiota bacterium]